ncbi:MAG: hypothetical protein PHN74_02270 [Candidatus Pacebacteria bacterium]|nr:hypothetical protein [Candidatus Paceibacterota bacterium]
MKAHLQKDTRCKKQTKFSKNKRLIGIVRKIDGHLTNEDMTELVCLRDPLAFVAWKKFKPLARKDDLEFIRSSAHYRAIKKAALDELMQRARTPELARKKFARRIRLFVFQPARSAGKVARITRDFVREMLVKAEELAGTPIEDVMESLSGS